MSAIDISEDQRRVLQSLDKWVKEWNAQYITVGGYAGTGKTTVAALFREALRTNFPDLKVAFCAFTGKAARVMEVTLRDLKLLNSRDKVGTIHSLIYSAVTNGNGDIVSWKKRDELEADIIIVDEASMVDQLIWQDLLSYGKPILAVGDHGQLPPVGGSFNLMENPELRLEKIHRQMEGHPIINLSFLARQSGYIAADKYSSTVVKYSRTDPFVRDAIEELIAGYDPSTLLLCGYNKTRINLNNEIRGRRGFETEKVEIGDRVVCLRNNHKAGLYNGMVGSINELDYILEEGQKFYFVELELEDDRTFKTYIAADQFGLGETMKSAPLAPGKIKADLFDFGYALTVHKAQGSQADKVIVFEERFPKSTEEEWRRWLYTAVTRAKNELYIIGD